MGSKVEFCGVLELLKVDFIIIPTALFGKLYRVIQKNACKVNMFVIFLH